MIPFKDLIRTSNNKSVMAYYGTDTNKRDFFAYIICDPQAAKRMYHNYQTRTQDKISDYGEVIYKDYISEPDDKAKEFLKKYLADNK